MCSPITKSKTMATALSGQRGSNPQPEVWKTPALPIELCPHIEDRRQFLVILSCFSYLYPIINMSKNLRVFLKNRHFKYTTFFQKRKTFFKIFPKVSIFNVLSLFRLLYNRNFFVFSVNGYIFFSIFFPKPCLFSKDKCITESVTDFPQSFCFFFLFQCTLCFQIYNFFRITKK